MDKQHEDGEDSIELLLLSSTSHWDLSWHPDQDKVLLEEIQEELPE